MGLYTLVRSKGYKSFMSKLYGWGASLVILGALFKILHLTGADYMLMLGMGIEAAIFFFSAFEPLHVTYKWELVYPELAIGTDEVAKGKAMPVGTPTQQLDRMLEEAKIGPELIESLATGMRNLSENAQKLSGASDAIIATDGYTENLTKASESARNLSLQYDKTADSLSKDINVSGEYLENVQRASSAVGNLASIYEHTTQSLENNASFHNDQLNKLNQSLTSINTIYELQAKNSQMVAESFQAIEENIKISAENTMKYKEEVENLTKSIAQLSNVYGNMVAAMSLSKL